MRNQHRNHAGTIIEAGQFWLSADEEFLSYVCGFDCEGLPVLEKADWIDVRGGEFCSIEKPWKTTFLHRIATNEEVLSHVPWLPQS